MHFNPHHMQKKYKKFWPTLLKYIAFLDNVVESVLHPCLKIKNEDIGDQVCPSLEEYCITEFLISRHDPESVNFFQSRCPINIERMVLTDFDWNQYIEHLPWEITGTAYNYNIDSVPNTNWGRLWDLVEQWHNRNIDIRWIMSWVLWEDDMGNIIGRQQPQTIGNQQEQDGGGAAGPRGETSGPEVGPSNAGSSMGGPQAIPLSSVPAIGFDPTILS
ncbi:hypothetical protein EDC04DRAFT_2607409 [Pisolithus marmoratus]|nr:hypothetical protein EDC04DRAFT_2607409 [Pisolithus marmoratus]